MSEISVVVVGSTSINSVVGNGDKVNVTVGGDGGVGNQAASVQVGTVTTLDATQTATVVNSGSAFAAKLDFGIPRGPTGLAGPPAVLTVGSVTTTTATTASVSITGTSPSQQISFVIPRGQQGAQGEAGPPNSLTVGSVTTTTATTASVSITGSAPSQTVSFVIPRGPQGIQGIQGIQGVVGPQGIQGEVGPAGPPASLTVGSVTTTTAATASVSITGNAPSQTISFVVPRGPQGEPGPFATIQAGTVTTGNAGTQAKVDAVASGSTVTLNFTIPRGQDGSVNLSDETPQPAGVASAGTALSAARADHVHAVPLISYANLTNVPSTFTPAAHTQTISTIDGLQAALDGKQPVGNYATLVGGTVPSSQLPSFVDDCLEYAALSGFPATGEVGKIYVARDTNKTYRWSGSTYIEISASPGSTDAVPEGSTNLYFTSQRAANASPVQSVAGRTGNVTLTSADVSGVVTGVNKIAGDVTLVAGANVTITPSGSTLTIAASGGGLGANDSVDGGFYVGELLYGITFSTQPQSVTVNSTLSANISSVSPNLTPTSYAAAGLASLNGTLYLPYVTLGDPYNIAPPSDPHNFVRDAAGHLLASSDNGTTFSIAATHGFITNSSSVNTEFALGQLNLTRNVSIASNGTRTLLTTGFTPTSSGDWNSYARYADASTITSNTTLTVLNGPVASALAFAWGGTRFAATVPNGSGIDIYTSSDGVNWTQRHTIANNTDGDLICGAGVYMFRGATEGAIRYSADGISWTATARSASGIATNGTKIVSVNGTTTASYSVNGVSWTNSTLPVGCSRVSFAGGLFWAWQDASSTDVCTSTDGVSWTLRNMPVSTTWIRAAGSGSTAFIRSAGNFAQGVVSTVGGSANLTVSATAASGNPVSYQWQRSLDAGASWANVANATSSNLTLANLTQADNGTRYRAYASATGASPATSQSALLTVTG